MEVAIRARLPGLVYADVTISHGTIAERGFADKVPPVLLPNLATKSLLPKIRKHELVEHTAELHGESRRRVIRIDVVGDRDESHTLVVELGNQLEHEIVGSRQTREIIDQDAVDQAVGDGRTQPDQAGPVPTGTGLSLVGIDVFIENQETTLTREAPARENLIVDARRTLVLGAVARVGGKPGNLHCEPSFPGSGETAGEGSAAR